MAQSISIDRSYLTEFLIGLLNTPSPTGLAAPAVEYTATALRLLGLDPRPTHKGGLLADWPGRSTQAPRALTAHVDTLGAMVKEIKDTGRLRLTQLGGFAWNTVEGEGCTVYTAEGNAFRGALLLTKASYHVFSQEVASLEREDASMEVRLDERSESEAETAGLGIDVGDFVAFDPRVEVSRSGFIRSRHLDDKAGVACLLAAAQAMKQAGLTPSQRVSLHISNYEEVGHGAASGLPADILELVAVDMAAVGEGQASDEFRVTICAKDSGGPYHVDLVRLFRHLALEAEIPHVVDIYPYYGSDAEAYWRAGGDVRVALIGPGVDASHNYERTHIDALVATARLIVEYLCA